MLCEKFTFELAYTPVLLSQNITRQREVCKIDENIDFLLCVKFYGSKTLEREDIRAQDIGAQKHIVSSILEYNKQKLLF